ncbi:MAG: MFS transporter [Candidatus Omnitrophica bacterium]|nr:MFS transporter [Candidatus Omnitrophota bacterium]
MEKNIKGSCKTGSFKALLIAQFMGAITDSLLKVVVSLYAIQILLSSEAATRAVSIVGVLYILPFVIFSPFAGHLADRFSKRMVIIVMGLVKVAFALLASGALWTGNLWFLCGTLFLFMVDSALFSPAKFGILPEMLHEEELSKGNGYIQLVTFVGIILGTAMGGLLFKPFNDHLYFIGLLMTFLALIGFGVSFAIRSEHQVSVKSQGFLSGTWKALVGIRHDTGLWLTMLALAFFNFLGATFQMNILIYGAHVLSVGQIQISILLVAVSLGIAAGSVLAGVASEGKVELGLVPLGAIGITIMSFLLGFGGHFYAALAMLFILGVCAGFYTVPLNAFFQRWSPTEERGQYLSVLNMVSSFGSLLAGGFLWFFGGQLAIGSDKIFWIVAVLSAIATVYIVVTLPIALVRLVNWVLAHSVYKLRVVNSDQVPEEGGALLIANHISYVDAVLILAALKRPVRYIMYRGIYDLPIINLFCRVLKVIPIDRDEGPKAIARALLEARKAIENGELVCIFPEGVLTRTGNMLPFNKGFEHIMKGLNAPIIPLYLDNIWGSIYTFSHGKYFWKIPRLTLYPVSIVFGKPMPATSRTHHVRLAVQELGAEANILRGAWRKKLHLAFIDEVKRHPFKFCMADSMGARFIYSKVFAAAVAAAKVLFPADRRPKETNEMVGVLLPSSCMAAISNIAVAFAGKVPVNLNFTLSAEAFDSCIKQCNMRMVITSRSFLEKAGISVRPEMVFLEDMKAKISAVKTGVYFLAAVLFPRWLLCNLFVRGDKLNVDDVATVIFSSGSTGEPKGVLLTHANVFSNIESLYQVFNIRREDTVVAALPFFHSFGFTATMCFPVGTAVGVVYHTNPLDASTIGKLTEKYKGTILMGTPTFMSAYVKKCSQEQFASVRMAVVGAEKLKEPLANAFQEKFGVTPFEGYGATELSPIVTVGFPSYVNDETMEQQVGHKFGKVGHPIPGVAVKAVDPDTFEIKGPNEEGLLLVKGANVMKGYLNNPGKTAEVLKDGWYITGDMATIDEDGFIKITDRLSRFSKIGGEMVPHIKVEENIMEALGATDPVVTVSSVADEKKGERLVVLHAVDMDVDAMCESLARKGIPNLWIPKKDSFYRVEAIPVLGTGKTDLKRVKALAQELSAAGKGEPHA